MDVEKLLKRLIPFDDIYSKERFLSILTPKLLESLKEQINSNCKWRDKAENEPVYFIVHNDIWKCSKSYCEHIPYIKIVLIGKEEIPVVSIYYFHKNQV